MLNREQPKNVFESKFPWLGRILSFIEKFSELATPITELTKKAFQFEWTDEANRFLEIEDQID